MKRGSREEAKTSGQKKTKKKVSLEWSIDLVHCTYSESSYLSFLPGYNPTRLTSTPSLSTPTGCCIPPTTTIWQSNANRNFHVNLGERETTQSPHLFKGWSAVISERYVSVLGSLRSNKKPKKWSRRRILSVSLGPFPYSPLDASDVSRPVFLGS